MWETDRRAGTELRGRLHVFIKREQSQSIDDVACTVFCAAVEEFLLRFAEKGHCQLDQQCKNESDEGGVEGDGKSGCHLSEGGQ